MPAKKSRVTKGNPAGLTWFKNVGKSLGLSTMDIITEMMPATMDTINVNKDMAKNVYDSIRMLRGKNTKGIEGMLSGAAEKNYATLKTAISNAKADIKTGNLYNKQRLNDSFNDGLDMDFDFDFSDDLGDDNFSDTDSESSDVKVIVPDVNITTNIDKNNPMVKAVQSQSDIILETSEAAAKRDVSIATTQMSLSKKLNDQLYHGMETINENLSLLVNFHSNNMTKYIGASLKYYEDQLRVTGETLELYKKSLEPPKTEERRSNDPLEDVFGSDGGFNIGGYAKLVKKQISDAMDSNIIASSLKMMFEDTDTLASIATQPLKFISDGIVKTFIPNFLKESLKSFDESLKNFVPAMLMRVNTLKNSDNPLLSLVGEIFGVNVENKKKIDTSKYERGAVPFDGLTRKSIVEVIPGYLSKILSTLNKSGDIAYNYETGKFERVTDIKKNFESDDRRRILNEYSGYTELLDRLDAFEFGDRNERDDFIKKMEGMFVKITDRMELVNPNKRRDKNGIEYDDLAEVTGMSGSELELLRGLIKSLPKNQQMKMFGSDVMNARKARTEYMNRMESDPGSIGAIMFNGLYDENLYKTPTAKINTYLSTAITEERRKYNASRGISTFNSIYDMPEDPEQILAMIKAHEDAKNSGATSDQNGKLIDLGKLFRGKNQEKYNSIHDVINKIVTAPANAVKKFFGKIDESMYEMVFGKTELEDKDGNIGAPVSFFGAILEKITKGFGNFFGYLKEKIYEPMREAMFGDNGIITKFKQSDAWKGMKEKAKKFSDYLFGTKGEDGHRHGGMFSDTANEMGDIFKGFKYYFTGKAYTNSKGESFADNEDSVFGHVKKMFTGFKNTLKEYFFGKNDEKKGQLKGVFTNAMSSIKQGFQNFADAMFGPKRFGDKENKNYVDINEVMGKLKTHAPKAVAHSMIGAGVGLVGSMGGLGLLGSMVLGPFSGAAIGLASSFLFQSDKFKNWLFGEKDPNTNERIGGFINKSTQEFFKKNKTGIIGGASVGALKGMLGIGILPSFILGGPLSGAIFGMASSMLFKSDKFQSWLFGDKQQDGSRINGILNKLLNRTNDADTKKRLGNIGAGALGGLGLGFLTSHFGILGALSIGPIGGAVAGAAAGIALSSDKWKKYLFGEFDEETGEKHGGLINKFMNFLSVEALQPLKVQMTEWKFNVMNWFDDKIAGPFLDAMDPLREEFNRFKQSVSNLFHNMWLSFKESPLIKGTKEHIIDPIIGGFKKYLFDPLTNAGKWLIEKAGKAIGGVLSAPLKALSFIADKLVVKHMRQGLRSVREKIIDNIKNSDFALGVKKYLVSPIQDGIDWMKDKTSKFFDGTKKIIKTGLGWGFKLLWTGFKGILSAPFKAIAAPFKLVGAIGNFIKSKRNPNVKNQDLQDDIWSGRGGSFLRSVGDLAQTFNPFSKIRHDAMYGEIDREKVKQSVADRFRRQHKKDGAVLTEEELERLTDEEMRKYKSGAFYESDRQKKRRERLEANEAKKRQRAETLAAMKDTLNFNKGLAEAAGFDTHDADGRSLSNIYKDLDKQLEAQYGKDWKNKSKFERDEFKRKQIELTTTKDIKENTGATVDRLDELNKLMKKVSDDLHKTVKNTDGESGVKTRLKLNKLSSLRGKIKSFDGPAKSADDPANTPDNPAHSHEDGLEEVPFDGYQAELHEGETVVPKKTKGVFSKIKSAGEKAAGFMKSFTSSISHAFSKSLAAEDARDDKEEAIKAEAASDKASLKEKHASTSRKTFAFQQQERAEALEKKEERSFRSQVLEKLSSTAGSVQAHAKGFFDTFDIKKGLITLAAIPALTFISKFLKDPGAALADVLRKAWSAVKIVVPAVGEVIVDTGKELFGLKDDNGDRTDATGDIQTNDDVIERSGVGAYNMARGAGKWINKQVKRVKKTVNTVKKIFGGGKGSKVGAEVGKEVAEEGLEKGGKAAVKVGTEVTEAGAKVGKEVAEEGLEKGGKAAVKVGKEVAEEGVEKGVKAAAKVGKEVAEEGVEKGVKAAVKVGKEVVEETAEGVLPKFLKAAKSAIASLKDEVLKFITKMGGKWASQIDDVFKIMVKNMKASKLGKFVGFIASKLGLGSGKEVAGKFTWGIVDAAVIVAGVATGATKSETANLFNVSQDDVNAGMQAVSGFFKGLLNAPFIWVIDIVFALIEMIAGIDLKKMLATALYKLLANKAADKALDAAQASFTVDYENYVKYQEMIDPDKKGKPESKDSYNDRVNKSVLAKVGSGLAAAGNWIADSVVGQRGNAKKHKEALANKAKFDEMLKKDPSLAEDDAFMLTYKQLKKQVDSTKKKKGLYGVTKEFLLGKDEYATDENGNILYGPDGNPITKKDKYGNTVKKKNKVGSVIANVSRGADALATLGMSEVYRGIKNNWKNKVIYETDENGNAILDKNGNPIPVKVDPKMSQAEIEKKYGKDVYYNKKTGQLEKKGLKTKTSETWNNVKDNVANFGKNVKETFSDDNVRKNLGLKDDVDVKLKDKLSVGLATALEKITGGKVDSSKSLKKIHGVFTLAENKWNDIQNGIKETWGNVKDKVKEGVNKANEKIGAVLGFEDENGNPLSLTDGLKQTYSKAKEKLIEGWNNAKSFVSEKWTDIKTGVKEKWNDVKDKVKEGVNKANEKLGAALGMVDEDGNSLSLTDGVKYNYEKIKGKLIEGWSTFKDTVSDKWNDIKDGIKEKWDKLKENVTKGLNIANEKIGAVLGMVDENGNPLSLTEGVKYNWKKTKEKLANGWQGLKDKASKTWDGIKNWFSNIGKSLESASESDIDSRNTGSGGVGGGIDGLVQDGPMTFYRYTSASDRKRHNIYGSYGERFSKNLTPLRGKDGVFVDDKGNSFGVGDSASDLLNQYSVTSNYGWRTLGGNKNLHKGIDLVISKNAPIKSFTDGKVVGIYSSAKPDSGYLGNYTDGGGFGNYVKLHTDDGKYTTYAHLNSVGVKVGDTVQQGDVIGKQGHTGNSTGSHLHFQVNTDSSASSHIEPTSYLKNYKSSGTTSSSISNDSSSSSSDTSMSNILSGVSDILSGYISPLSDAMSTVSNEMNNILSSVMGSTTSTSGTTTFNSNLDTSQLVNMDIAKELPKLSVSQIREIIRKKFPSDSVVKVTDAEGIYKAQQQTGMSALAILGIGALESGWGTSAIAKNKGNLWGWNATNANPYGDATTFSSTAGSAALEYAKNYMDLYYTARGSKSIYSTGSGNNPSGKGYAYNDDGSISQSWHPKVGDIMEQLYEIAKTVEAEGGVGGGLDFTKGLLTQRPKKSERRSNRDLFKRIGSKVIESVSNKDDAGIGGPVTKSPIPEGFWDNVIQVLRVIAENTGGTTDNIQSLIDTVKSKKSDTVVTSTNTVNNNQSTNPMYQIANDRRNEITNKNYKTAKLIAQGVN